MDRVRRTIGKGRDSSLDQGFRVWARDQRVCGKPGTACSRIRAGPGSGPVVHATCGGLSRASKSLAVSTGRPGIANQFVLRDTYQRVGRAEGRASRRGLSATGL